MKTFNEFLTDNATFWDNHTDYPVAVQNLIKDWYYYRYICSEDDAQYTKFLGRKLNNLSWQFNNLYNKQLYMDFTPIQLEKIEKTINTVNAHTASEIVKRILDGTTDNTGTNSLDTERTLSNTDTKTLNTTNLATQDLTNATTQDLTNTVNLTNSTDTTNKDTGTTTNSGTTSGTSDNKVSDYPQSTPTGGFANYISGENQTTTSGTSGNTTTNDLTNTIDSTTTNTGTYKDTGTSTLNIDGTITTKDTGTITDVIASTEANNSVNTLALKLKTDNTEDITKNNEINATISIIESEIKSGNGSELFDAYFKFIRRTNAVEWLIGELDVCFLQIYDLETYTENPDATAELQEQIDQLFTITTDLDTRVTVIEENGSVGIGDVTKAYVDAQDAALRNSINTNTANLNNAIADFTASITTTNTNVTNLDTRVTTLEENPGGGTDMSWRVYTGTPIEVISPTYYMSYIRNCELYVCGTSKSNMSVYLKLYSKMNLTDTEFASLPAGSMSGSNAQKEGAYFNLSASDKTLLSGVAINTQFFAPNDSFVDGFFPVIRNADGTIYGMYYPSPSGGAGCSLENGVYGAESKFAIYTKNANTSILTNASTDTNGNIYNNSKDNYVFIKLV